MKSKADIEAKEKAFLSEIENAKAEALVEKEKCHLELTKKEQKQKHRNKVSEWMVRVFQGVLSKAQIKSSEGKNSRQSESNKQLKK